MTDAPEPEIPTPPDEASQVGPLAESKVETAIETATGRVQLAATAVLGGLLPFWLLAWGWMYQDAVGDYQREHAAEIEAWKSLVETFGVPEEEAPHLVAYRELALSTALDAAAGALALIVVVATAAGLVVLGRSVAARPGTIALPQPAEGVAAGHWEVERTAGLHAASHVPRAPRVWASAVATSAAGWAVAAAAAMGGLLDDAPWGWVMPLSLTDDEITAMVDSGGPILCLSLAAARLGARLLALAERGLTPGAGAWLGAELTLALLELGSIAWFLPGSEPLPPAFAVYVGAVVVAHLGSARGLALASRGEP